MFEFYDGHHLQALLLQFLDRRDFPLPLFLAIECDGDRGDLCAMGFNQRDRFADGGTGGDHIVDDHYPAAQLGADDITTLTVILGFLAVECVGQVALMQLEQGAGSDRRQWNALVSGSEEQVEFDSRVFDGVGIEFRQRRQIGAPVEDAGVKKVGAYASGFEFEFTKFEGATLQAIVDEAGLVVVHKRFVSGGRVKSCIISPEFDIGSIKMRVISVNTNGIRAAARKGFFDWLPYQRADFICVQETKAQVDQLDQPLFHPARYHCSYFDALKKGYAGTAIYSLQKPLQVIRGFGESEFDNEGRYLEYRYKNLSVISLYAPSGSSGDHRQESKWRFMDSFLLHLQALRRKRREFIICGDWNIAHQNVDLKNWRSNQKNSGFLPEERAWLSDLFERVGFVDAFRVVDPRPEQYTWWSNRGQSWDNNVGWRIDYQIVTPGLRERVQRARIYRDRRFSDHAPLIMDYDMDLEQQ